MYKPRNLWIIIKEQQARIAILTSLIALVVGVINSLLDVANPPVLTMLVFSICVLGFCVWIAFSRQFTRRRLIAAWISAVLILATGWGFIYRERIRFSVLADRILRGQRVVVSDAVAWEILKYPAGEKSKTVVGEVASLLSGSPYRPVVLKERELVHSDRHERDGFIIRGAADKLGVVLKASVVIKEATVKKLIGDASAGAKIGDYSGFLPSNRFFQNQFLLSHLEIEAPLLSGISPGERATLARVVLRYALATTFYCDGRPEAADVFTQIVTLADLLPKKQSAPLAQIYKTTAYYLAVNGKETEAVKALDFAHTFAPADGEINIMEAYLFLASGNTGKALELVESLKALADDPAILPELRAECFYAADHLDETLTELKRAVQLERHDDYKSLLNIDIALVSGRTSGTRPELITGPEAAAALGSQSIVNDLLQGFAWANQGNSDKSKEAFSRAKSKIKSQEHQDAYTHWWGRSLFQLKEYGRAASDLEKAIGDPASTAKADLLLIYCQNLMNIPGKEADAEKYLGRVIDLEPKNGKAHRWKALALVKRMGRSGAEDRQDQLNAEARSHLQQAIRYEDEEASNYFLLAALYEEAGDPINAEEQRNLGSERYPNDPDAVLHTAKKRVESGDFSGAKATFAKLRKMFPEDADRRIEEASEWYQAHRLDEAENAYEEALKLDPKSERAHDNLAFVLFDLGRYDDALKHWDEALQVQPKSPDALAGKAIALEATGHHEDAITTYKTATDLDPRFRDLKVLQSEFAWSEVARKTAAKLIPEIKGE
jgi:tetratricopeptide (TPR) repeat protein